MKKAFFHQQNRKSRAQEKERERAIIIRIIITIFSKLWMQNGKRGQDRVGCPHSSSEPIVSMLPRDAKRDRGY